MIWGLVFQDSNYAYGCRTLCTASPTPPSSPCGRTGTDGSFRCPLLSVTSANQQQRTCEFGKLQIYSKKKKIHQPWVSLFSFLLSQFYYFIVPWYTRRKRGRYILVGSECVARLIFVPPGIPYYYKLAKRCCGEIDVHLVLQWVTTGTQAVLWGLWRNISVSWHIDLSHDWDERRSGIFKEKIGIDKYFSQVEPEKLHFIGQAIPLYSNIFSIHTKAYPSLVWIRGRL